MIFNPLSSNKKPISIFNALLILLLCSPSLSAGAEAKVKQNAPYNTIGNMYISSFGIVEQSVETKNTSPNTKNSTPTLEIAQLTDKEKLEIVFNLFSAYELPGEISNNIVTIVKDLELFVGQGKDPQAHIFNKLNNTVTTFGEVKLAHILANPTNDIAALKARQNLVKELLANKELFNRVELFLQKVKKAEKGFFSFWKEEDAASKELFEKRLFFNKGFCEQFNTNPHMLEASIRIGNLGTTWDSLSTITQVFVCDYVMAKIAVISGIPQQNSPLKSALYSLGDLFKNLNPYRGIQNYRLAKESFLNATTPEGKVLFSPEIAQKIALGKTLFVTGYSYFVTGKWAWDIKNAMQDAQLIKNAINHLHIRVNDVAGIVEGCTVLNALAQENEFIAAGLFSRMGAKQLFETSDNADFDKLISLLQTNTFKGDASFFSLSGRALCAYQLMKEHKQKFAAALEALGEIDACMSIAKLYKNAPSELIHYNFVDYNENGQPYFEVIGFWHPLVSADKVVTNDIILNKNSQNRNIILTGSNTGGKSTMLKAIILSTLLGQTITIVPAQYASFAPFAYLGSYLHVLDDVAAGNSLFKSEVLRAQSLLDNAQNLSDHNYGFVVIDELFTGTASDKGAQAAYKVAHKLSAMNNIIYILATHFPELTALEEATAGVCKNYKVDVIKKEDGSIVRPFKIESGISITSIANDILQEELANIDFSA